MTRLNRFMQIMLKIVHFIIYPPPSREALLARENADRVMMASIEYNEAQNVLGDLLRDMPRRRERRKAGK